MKFTSKDSLLIGHAMFSLGHHSEASLQQPKYTPAIFMLYLHIKKHLIDVKDLCQDGWTCKMHMCRWWWRIHSPAPHPLPPLHCRSGALKLIGDVCVAFVGILILWHPPVRCHVDDNEATHLILCWHLDPLAGCILDATTMTVKVELSSNEPHSISSFLLQRRRRRRRFDYVTS